MIRLDLDEISSKTQKHKLFNSKFVIRSPFPTKAKIGEDLAEDPTSRPILVPVPNSPPIERYHQNTISSHTTSNYDFLFVFLRFRVQICDFRP